MKPSRKKAIIQSYIPNYVEAPPSKDFNKVKWLNRCYGYIRVSTEKQVGEGISLDLQEHHITQWAINNKFELIEIRKDKGESGSKLEHREALLEIIRDIKEGETLVVYSSSRMTRSAWDNGFITKQLASKGCNYVSVSDNFNTRDKSSLMAMTFMSAMSEIEVNIMRQRVKDGMERKKQKGQHVGKPPYGWKLAGDKGSGLEEIPEQQAVILRIHQLRNTRDEEGRLYSYVKIAVLLDAEGIPPPSTKSEHGWASTSVMKIAKRSNVNVKGRSPTYSRKK